MCVPTCCYGPDVAKHVVSREVVRDLFRSRTLGRPDVWQGAPDAETMPGRLLQDLLGVSCT